MYRFSETSIMRMAGVDPALVDLMHRSIKISRVDFGIASGLRTTEEQQALWAQGRKLVNGVWVVDMASKIVTHLDGIERKSKHQEGKAIDVYAWVNGRASWNRVHLALIAGTIMSEAVRSGMYVRWGGTFGSNEWQGWDMPHFEI